MSGSLPAIDAAVLGQLRALGGEALVARLVGLFFDSSKGYVADIESGLEEGDFERVEKAAHTLKSGAGSLGALQVHRFAEELEAAARGADPQATRRCWEVLSESYRRACEELGRVLEG